MFVNRGLGNAIISFFVFFFFASLVFKSTTRVL
jgi:hypothetical protein